MFIPGVLPGELVSVRIKRAKKRFARAQLLEVLEPSQARAPSPCPHYARCGGCDLLHAEFAAQMPMKAHAAEEAFARLSGLEAIPAPRYRAAPRWDGWRTRAMFRLRRFSDALQVGLLERGSHRLVAIDRCGVCVEPLQLALGELKRALQSSPIEQAEVLLELATSRQEVVASLREVKPDRSRAERAEIEACLERLVARSEVLRGVRWRRGELIRAWGEPSIEADLLWGRCPEALKGELAPPGLFRQAHVSLSGELVDQVVEEALRGEPRGGVLELFAGSGNFSFALEEAGAEQVRALEGEGEAVAFGRQVAARHERSVDFLEVDLFKPSWLGALDGGVSERAVVLDPPRAGARQACHDLAGCERVERVVYVACDPTSLARDVAVLVERGGFEIARWTIWDMFPGTAHLETVMVCER